MSEQDHRKEILEKLQLVTDEPEVENIQFDFDAYSKQIVKILTDERLVGPFTIGIHGAWGGSGKTTLIREN